MKWFMGKLKCEYIYLEHPVVLQIDSNHFFKNKKAISGEKEVGSVCIIH